MRPVARKGLRTIGAALAAFAAAAPAWAAPVATVSAQVVRPVELTWVQDLDLGTITLGPGTWSGATVGISQTGVFSCSNANVTCTGTTSVAQYTVVGTNKQVDPDPRSERHSGQPERPDQDADADRGQPRLGHADQLRQAGHHIQPRRVHFGELQHAVRRLYRHVRRHRRLLSGARSAGAHFTVMVDRK